MVYLRINNDIQHVRNTINLNINEEDFYPYSLFTLNRTKEAKTIKKKKKINNYC